MKRKRIEICSLDFLMFAYERRLEEEELMDEGRMEVCERASVYEMKKRKYKNKKRLKLNNNLQTMRNVLEGDRIYHLMAQAMLSADTSVGGTVAMNYALGKLIAIYKQAMKGLGIDVEAYISDMTDWWSRKISEGADAEDKAQFDEFMTSVETQTLIDTISK